MFSSLGSKFGWSFARGSTPRIKVLIDNFTLQKQPVEVNSAANPDKMASVAALKSKDVPEINKARAVIKGQITNGIKKLESNLSKVAEGDFDHGNISRNEIVQAHTKLNENLDLFQKLHLRYCEFRDVGKDALTEDNLVEQDGEYLEEVESKVFPMLNACFFTI